MKCLIPVHRRRGHVPPAAGGQADPRAQQAAAVARFYHTRRSDLYPSLAFPFYHEIGSRMATFVCDGETIMLWTKRRLPGYRQWQIRSGPRGFEPLDWRKFYMGGAFFPASPVPKRKKDTRPHRNFRRRGVDSGLAAGAAGRARHCWLGSSTTKPAEGRGPLPVVSVAWSPGSIARHGIII